MLPQTDSRLPFSDSYGKVEVAIASFPDDQDLMTGVKAMAHLTLLRSSPKGSPEFAKTSMLFEVEWVN